MANSRTSGGRWEYATVNAAIDSSEEGYYTNSVSLETKKNRLAPRLYFSVREASSNESVDASVMTVSLQFRCKGDGRWQDFNYNDGTAFVAGDRIILEDMGPNVEWRAGVKWDEYTSGSLIFGFDW